MSPQAEALDKELRRIHYEDGVAYGIHQPDRRSFLERTGEFLWMAFNIVLLMAVGGIVTVAVLSYYDWISFPHFYM
jgi:hypothetical protein